VLRVGVEESIDMSLLAAFGDAVEIVRIPAKPAAKIAIDFWIPSLSPATSRRQWPYLKGVKVVQALWAGVDTVRAMIPRSVILCNARGVHDGPTAEWAVAAVLAMQKYLPFYIGLQQREDWDGKNKAEAIYLLSEGAIRDAASPVLIEEISEKVVLIVGYGSIGRAIERRLEPFGATFLRVARSARDGVAATTALDDLLPLADIVVLVTPLTTETRHLMDAARLAKMKRGALLVNVGRGAVVDTEALASALRDGKIRAAMDVTDPEPLPRGHPLWKAPNLLITPHVATDTPRFTARAFAFAAQQALRLASGGELQNIVHGEY
jgi:phosphoglycerate dehydrogenase-like enzyme